MYIPKKERNNIMDIAWLEHIMHAIVEIAIILLEFVGLCILLLSAGKSVIRYFKKDPEVRLTLAQGIALALEFKLGGEVLRTVIVREWTELLILGAIIALRGALTLLIHWEISVEEKREKSLLEDHKD